MNAKAQIVYKTDSQPAPRFSELDTVHATRAIENEHGRFVAFGAIGTVVAVWSEGAGYEVEFGEEPEDLFTVDPQDIALAQPQG